MNLMNIIKKIGRTVESVGLQKAARVKPLSEEETKLAVLQRIAEATDKLKSEGGFTIDPRTGKLVEVGTQYGHFMSPMPNSQSVQLPFSESMTPEDIMNAIPQEYWPRLQRGGYLGSWVDNGNVYLDPAERHITKLNSVNQGLKTDQMQGTNLRIPFGPTGNEPFYNVTPEELERQKEIALKTALYTMGTGTTGGIGTYAYGKIRNRRGNE